MKELMISLLNFFGWAFWVEIVTEAPRCTYYFGPFMTTKEAESAKAGYIEDLQQEGAQGIGVKIKRCKPLKLTVYDEKGEMIDRKAMPIFSGQS